MKQHLIHLLTGCIFFSLLLAGCSNQQTTALKPQPNKPLPKSHHDTQDVHNKKTDAKQDGQVISMEKIKVSGINPQVTPYRMMYWSEGTKAEAYIAIPSSGRYPLYVSLHGGYLEPLKKSHVTEVGNVHYGKNIIEFARDNTITIAPMYRGYGHSDGTINGIYKNTIDTENAVKALMNYTKTHKDFPDIKKGHTYLHGVSMGGGVALRLAAERKNVLSVVAVSPFVGWDILGSWYEEHNPGRLYDVVGYFNKSFDPDSPTYQRQSVPYKKITAPTLLIQGTKDKLIVWQTVQTLYQKMKANGQKVTFKLVDGGNHVLMNKQDILFELLRDWRSKHWVG